MEKVELKFMRIAYSHAHTGAYALLLKEVDGDRRLPIVIGGTEAQAIAIQAENIKPARPMTHDLFKNMCDSLGITLVEVVINDLVEGVFHAKLLLEWNGQTQEVDARTSDAIALALRFNCPIHTFEFIIAAAGMKMSEGDDEDEEQETGAGPDGPKGELDLRKASSEQLKGLLEEALETEDYERASKLRDELKRREGTN